MKEFPEYVLAQPEGRSAGQNGRFPHAAERISEQVGNKQMGDTGRIIYLSNVSQLRYGCGSKLNLQRPQVLVHISSYQGFILATHFCAMAM